MEIDDMILVSIDDHVIEPPDMFEGHVPAKWASQAPKLVTEADGSQYWEFQGAQTGNAGLNAVVSWPPEEWGLDPASYSEMRPGAYDIHERVRDMNRNGVFASMCFPTFPGFSAGHLSIARDELSYVMIQAYNDWHIDEWAATYPGRFIPLALWGPAMRTYPDLKIAWSEAGIGWIPFYLDRCDRHYSNQRWLRRDFGGRLPSDVFREHSLACYVTDPVALKVRRDIGIDIIAWECDYPHSDSIWPDAPEHVMREMVGAGATDEEIDKITWQNTCRFFDWDAFGHIAKEQATVGALRSQAMDVDTSIRSRREWSQLYAQRQAS